MTHSHHHDHPNHQTHPKQKRPIHHDWRFWVSLGAVILMLVAMVIYTSTDDESLQPGGGTGPAMPAAAE